MRNVELIVAFLTAGAIAVAVKLLSARREFQIAGVVAAVPINTIFGYCLLAMTGESRGISTAARGTMLSLAATSVMLAVVFFIAGRCSDWSTVAVSVVVWPLAFLALRQIIS
jgi:uncharacterized membrane protein (GlpM family)